MARLTRGGAPGQPPTTPSRVSPGAAAIRSMVSPTLLLGVEAPAVTSTVNGAAGSNPGPIPDAVAVGIKARIILDVIGAHLLLADGREVGGVARVVSADHHHHVEWLRDELQYRVLAILRGRADGVERAEMLGHALLPVPLGHRLPQLGRDGERLARQHR